MDSVHWTPSKYAPNEIHYSMYLSLMKKAFVCSSPGAELCFSRPSDAILPLITIFLTTPPSLKIESAVDEKIPGHASD